MELNKITSRYKSNCLIHYPLILSNVNSNVINTDLPKEVINSKYNIVNNFEYTINGKKLKY